MSALSNLFESVRLELFTIRECALAENFSDAELIRPVYNNDDENAEDKDLNNAQARDLAAKAILG